MAQERKGSVGTQGTLRDILTVLEKKIRNLEKRKSRLEQVEKDIEQGKEVGENQRIALSKKDQVLDMLEVCRDFLQTAEQLAKNDEVVARTKAKKEQREANQRIIDTLENVLRLQFLLGEALRRVEAEDNEDLEALRSHVDVLSSKDFSKVAELWMNVLEAKPKEFAPGITFEAVHSKLLSMGELLNNLNEISACGEAVEATPEEEQGFRCGSDARNDSPVSAEGNVSDSKIVNAEADNVLQRDGSAVMHHAGDQQVPLEQVEAVQPQLHEQVASAHHSAAPPVHHHPAAILLKGKKGGEDMFCTVAFYSHTPIDDFRYLLPHRELVRPPPLPQVMSPQGGPPTQGHHPGGVVTVLPGMNVVPVSPVQPAQSLEEDNNDTIQFGSVENPIPVQSQHLINGTPFCGSDANRPVAAAAPNPDAMFGDREFDFFQDDLLVQPPTATAAAATPAVTAAPTVPAPMMLHPDPAVVHVQTGTSGGTPSLVPTHASFNAHYQQLLQMQPHLGPQQQPLQSHHHQQQQQQAHIHNKTGSGQMQQQQQQSNTHENEDAQRQKQDSVERQKGDHPGHQNQVGGQHQQGMHGPNNGHHNQHRHERRSPRDNNNSRGDHDGQQHKPNSTYYRAMNGGASQGGHNKGHYGDSSGRTNWSENRRSENNANGNTNRGNTWNRNDRSYNNGPPRHHGNNGGGYGNRGGMMGRREQTAQRV